MSFTREQLESWAGKPSFRAGLQLALQSGAEIRLEKGLSIRFSTINAQCHYAPGGGLDGIIVSGSVKDERRVAVAAVIAFQRQNGVTWEALAGQGATLEESSGTPRSRSEVLAVAQQLFNEMLDNGLAHISSAMQQRLVTLAVSAVGVNLPRLSLRLRGLADECRLALGRDAGSDLGRLLARMAYAHALCTALQAGGPDPGRTWWAGTGRITTRSGIWTWPALPPGPGALPPATAGLPCCSGIGLPGAGTPGRSPGPFSKRRVLIPCCVTPSPARGKGPSPRGVWRVVAFAS